MMDKTEIIRQILSVTWQQGIIYPEQHMALNNALELIEPESFNYPTMKAGEIARHLKRILKGDVWKPAKFRLTELQKQALEEVIKLLLQSENNELDAEKGRYD